MLTRANHILTSARSWLIGAAVAVGASFALDYMQIQAAAEAMLSALQGAPRADASDALILAAQSQISSLLFWTGAAMALFALALSCRDVAREGLPWNRDDAVGTDHPIKTPRFQPLAGQNEIIKETQPANDTRAPLRRAIGSLFDDG